MNDRKWHFFIPAAVALVSVLAVLAGIFNFWFGAPRGDFMWFCERVREGFIKQPANTWSNVGFVLAGLYIGWLSYKNRFTAANYMTRTFLFPVSFASIVVFLGPGSMAMHATNAPWGGFLDLLSMFLIASFIFTYALKRLFRLPAWLFAGLYVALVAASAKINLSPINQATPYLTLSEYIFAAQLIFSFPMEIIIRYRGKTRSLLLRGAGSVASMCLAFLIWNLSRTTESWFCNPDSLIQGHAIWHILNAFSAYLLFMYYASENDGAFVAAT